jgi:hypothetical protein
MEKPRLFVQHGGTALNGFAPEGQVLVWPEHKSRFGVGAAMLGHQAPARELAGGLHPRQAGAMQSRFLALRLAFEQFIADSQVCKARLGLRKLCTLLRYPNL